MPAAYDAIKDSLVKQGVGDSTSSPAVKTSASKIFIARGKGGDRSSRAKALQADRKPKRDAAGERPWGR